jgi:hypothetical protein
VPDFGGLSKITLGGGRKTFVRTRVK